MQCTFVFTKSRKATKATLFVCPGELLKLARMLIAAKGVSIMKNGYNALELGGEYGAAVIGERGTGCSSSDLALAWHEDRKGLAGPESSGWLFSAPLAPMREEVVVSFYAFFLSK